jgi:hypothetical protein
MPFTGNRLMLSSTPQLVWSATGKTNVFLRSGGGSQFIGPDNAVTATTGAWLQPGVLNQYVLHTGDELWAVVAAGSVDLGVIVIT